MWNRILLAAGFFMAAEAAPAQDTVKIGIVMSFSGPFAKYGEETKRGIDLFFDESGGKVGGVKAEIIYRDEQGPEKTKQGTQELIVREGVQIIAGYNLSPDALAVAPVLTQSKMPAIVLTAGASVITRRSPYFTRLSFTVAQSSSVIGEWAARGGIKNAVIAFTDYAPGHDSIAAFRTAFTKGGGNVVDQLGMPLATTDFGPYVQKVRDLKPEAVFLFTPAGPPAVGFVKAFSSFGLRTAGVKLLTTASSDELDLPAMGEDAAGALSAWHYSPHLDTPENKRFVAAFKKKFGASLLPTFQAVHSYDAMKAIDAVVARFGPSFNGDQAMSVLKGWSFVSPRGPILIDPIEGDIVQNQYIRRVEKTADGWANVVLETRTAVKDPWQLANPR